MRASAIQKARERSLALAGLLALMVAVLLGPARDAQASLLAWALEAEDTPTQLWVGTEVEVPITIRNLGNHPWLPGFADRLSYHWRSESGELLIRDGLRTPIVEVVAPGEAIELQARLRPPDEPGRYQLVLDVVQEGVRWFANAGSVPLIVAATVVAPEAAPSDDAAIDPRLLDLLDPEAAPRAFSMAGIPVEEMKALITASGGELLSLDEHVTEWHSFTYHVRRLPVPVG